MAVVIPGAREGFRSVARTQNRVLLAKEMAGRPGSERKGRFPAFAASLLACESPGVRPAAPRMTGGGQIGA
jgi:hypothetical protein